MSEGKRISLSDSPGRDAQRQGQEISVLTLADAAAVAELHRKAISTSFLASLGRGFATHLYKGLLSSPSAFGFACKGTDGQLLGYVACAESTSAVYRQALIRHGAVMAFWLLPCLWRFSVLARLWETLVYPAALPGDLPDAEVLSIAVAPEAHGRGIGTSLMAAAFAEFRQRGISHVKVAVGAENSLAIAFYQRCGFHLAMTRTHHGKPMNIYTIQL